MNDQNQWFYWLVMALNTDPERITENAFLERPKPMTNNQPTNPSGVSGWLVGCVAPWLVGDASRTNVEESPLSSLGNPPWVFDARTGGVADGEGCESPATHGRSREPKGAAL